MALDDLAYKAIMSDDDVTCKDKMSEFDSGAGDISLSADLDGASPYTRYLIGVTLGGAILRLWPPIHSLPRS